MGLIARAAPRRRLRRRITSAVLAALALAVPFTAGTAGRARGERNGQGQDRQHGTRDPAPEAPSWRGPRDQLHDGLLRRRARLILIYVLIFTVKLARLLETVKRLWGSLPGAQPPTPGVTSAILPGDDRM